MSQGAVTDRVDIPNQTIPQPLGIRLGWQCCQVTLVSSPAVYSLRELPWWAQLLERDAGLMPCQGVKDNWVRKCKSVQLWGSSEAPVREPCVPLQCSTNQPQNSSGLQQQPGPSAEGRGGHRAWAQPVTVL